ncbi:MAG: cyclic nucleotide-binding domain-containing protein [Salinivirgaceae bacterium]|nr:cyclic nucleotide-binding domain-containing protein [Salinivirgaceae bacterium]
MSKINSDIISVLKEVEIFSGFDESILQEFASNMKEIYVKADQSIFNKGDKESAMYIIMDGSVQIHDNNYIFTTLNNKQFFGEYSLIDSAVRSATVTAVRNTHLLELQQSSFNKVTASKPELWKSVLITLIKRLRDYNILEEKLTMRTLDIQKKKYEVEKEKENIVKQKKELEAINSTKDKFFTIIAHDLKNPFSTVISISDILLSKYENYDNEKTINYIEQINRFSRNAFNLLENLLQWARSQTGSLKINFRRANPSNIVDDILELFAVSAMQKNITFHKEIDSNLHGYFDVDMVTTVFRNLISNAIKFTNQNGDIHIIAEESGDMFTVEIKDNGIGIDKEKADSLFRIDKRSVNGGSNDNEGTGLGLILCKEFVSKNGGEIWAESVPNEGTSIKFTLPKAL